MKNLNELFEYAMWVVEECGIETGEITSVTVNTRAKKRFGQCQYRNGTYRINISEFILADETEENAVMETIIHEILHTCKGCMNHGKEWKRLANIVYQKSGYNITRTSSTTKFGIEEEDTANYVFVCEKCGQVIKRDRMSNFVKYSHLYTCGKCGGHFKQDMEHSKCVVTRATSGFKSVANSRA